MEETEAKVLKKIRTIATVVVGVFFVLVVGVIVQFAMVNHNNNRKDEVRELIARREQQAKEMEQNKSYYDGEDFRREWLADAGYTETK